jgi:hypothetical protein
MASKPRSWKGEIMKQYGFAVTYYPAGVSSERSLILFEIKTYEEGRGTRFTEILDMEFDMPTAVEAQATEKAWMTQILAEALAMVPHASELDKGAIVTPAVVKRYVESGILPDQE